MEIPKTYDPRQAEQQHYARWERAGCFAPEANKDAQAKPYSIVIPPPNVTGSLHMGHALQHTIMDVLARYHRMRGFKTLWVVGTDHAGISTQIVVERELKKEGLTRHDLGREKFVERVWEWKHKSGGRITEQLRREGASVDWSRERFTMDERLSRAVREFFVRCFDEGLIYRGERLINWCPKDQTALSDLEVDKETQKGKLWFLQYPVKGSERRVTVATTRPETMLGDTAVAVNPSDQRYKELIGATIELPLTNREIRIIADEAVDPAFGTGAVKVTPAHDPADYEMGERHNLPQLVVIDSHARMTDEAGADFEGLDRYEARERVVEKFESLGLLEKIEDYEGAISRCERCRTVIEPLISLQWFCKQKELALKGLEFIRDRHEPHFVPQVPWEKVYTDWLDNLHDWTLSRQLWWGHRIPAWYDKAGRIYVARSEEEARAKAGTDNLTQDPDVLDTWFSSALWPISTLGWPDEASEDLKTYYPTDVLVTARDIIFLWVSRMVMTGTKFVGKLPFRDVFITGIVLDKNGQKMSKMKNNIIDPMDVFEKYGVDATRIALAASSTGIDFPWRDEKVESYRNFANKIWNAARFCLMNSEGAQVGKGFEGDPKTWALHDRWIISELNKTARDVSKAIETYQFHEAVYALYHFFWDDFCDWYIELSKADVAAAEASIERDAARSRIITVLERALRLLHPFMPFITEELWLRLPGIGAESLHASYRGMEPTVMLTEYPHADDSLIDERAESEMASLIELVSRVRNIRTELNVKPAQQVELLIEATNGDALAPEIKSQVQRLTRASGIAEKSRDEWPRASAVAVLAGGKAVGVPLEGLIDFEQEIARLNKETEKLQKELDKLKAQLSNTQFVERAPAEKVEELRQRSSDITQRMDALAQMLEALKG